MIIPINCRLCLKTYGFFILNRPYDWECLDCFYKELKKQENATFNKKK